jgi:hypothetical protein
MTTVIDADRAAERHASYLAVYRRVLADREARRRELQAAKEQALADAADPQATQGAASLAKERARLLDGDLFHLSLDDQGLARTRAWCRETAPPALGRLLADIDSALRQLDSARIRVGRRVVVGPDGSPVLDDEGFITKQTVSNIGELSARRAALQAARQQVEGAILLEYHEGQAVAEAVRPELGLEGGD